MTIYGLYIVKNGTGIDIVKDNIRECKESIKDYQRDIHYAEKLIAKTMTKIRECEAKIKEYQQLTIVNGKVKK